MEKATRFVFSVIRNKDRIDHILGHPRYDGVKFIVVNDGNESWDSAIKAQEAWVANPNAAMRLRK
jgi:hypothetical protein